MWGLNIPRGFESRPLRQPAFGGMQASADEKSELMQRKGISGEAESPCMEKRRARDRTMADDKASDEKSKADDKAMH